VRRRRGLDGRERRRVDEVGGHSCLLRVVLTIFTIITSKSHASGWHSKSGMQPPSAERAVRICAIWLRNWTDMKAAPGCNYILNRIFREVVGRVCSESMRGGKTPEPTARMSDESSNWLASC
jgi:hypothetical protein